MWDISELNLSLLFLSEIDKYVKSMFEFSNAENIIKSFFCFLSAFFPFLLVSISFKEIIMEVSRSKKRMKKISFFDRQIHIFAFVFLKSLIWNFPTRSIR